MTEKREFKMGLIGCGRISQAYVQAIETLDDVKLVGVMDTRSDAALAVGEAMACPAYGDLDRFVEDVDMDGVIICSPPSTHRTVATKVLEAGVNVLCEKPFATNSADAIAMLDTAKERDLIMMMASKFRFAEDIIRAKSMINSGMLGRIQFYENRFAAKVEMKDRWNSDPAVSGGGVIIDNGTHSVDIIRYLLGPIEKISTVEGDRLSDLAVEDTATVSAITKSGANCTINLSWAMQIVREDYINIYGTDGAIHIGWKGSSYQYNGHQEWVPFGVGYNKVDSFKRQIDNFCDAVRGSVAPSISADEILASVAVIEKAYESMETKNWAVVSDSVSGVENRIAMPAKIHPTAIIEEGVTIGEGSSVWDNCHIRHHAKIGDETIIGEKTYVAYEVEIGDHVKINAFVYICAGVKIEAMCMISAGTIFTNDRFPRAMNRELTAPETSNPTDETLETIVRQGTTIGAGAIIGPGIELGEFSMVGMGAVVTKSVPPQALVVGNPAKITGYVCICGPRLVSINNLPEENSSINCERCNRTYNWKNNSLKLIEE